jgi:ActR/RegA family two-component response regulator
MREANGEEVSRAPEGLTTSFPIVPIAGVPAPEASDSAGALRPVVLVVDDEPGNADTLTEILDRNGYAAIPAYDAETALETALLVPPELAVIDVGLSGSSGMELADSLRGKLPDCKIVLISGDTGSSELLATVKAAQLELRSDPAIRDQMPETADLKV